MLQDSLLDRLTAAWPLDRWIGRKVIVAISGGPDSVALLSALVASHARAGGTGKVVAAHFNHRLRGQESDGDETFVREFCKKLQVEVIVGQAEHSIADEKRRRGLEGSARDARYDFLRQIALAEGARYVATAHTADDQAETILHHILRGTGLGGLRGMPRVRKLTEGVSLIRPFLSFSRSDLREYLSAISQDYHTDSSNADTDRTRNRIRHELLPLLAKEYNPEVAEALVRLGQLAGEAHEIVEKQAADLAQRAILERAEERVALQVNMLKEAAPLLVREVFVWIWREFGWPRDAMGLDEWEALYFLATFKATIPAARSFPGSIVAMRHLEKIVISHESLRRK